MHAVDGGTVAKIYRPERRTAAAFRKLEVMLATPIRDPRLAWPVELLMDHGGTPIGSLMPRAAGQQLQRSVFIPTRLTERLRGWTRLQLVDLTLALLDAVEVLHRHGVLVGDVNGANVLVDSDPTRVVLVDLDSCQIGDFRCPVGTPPFLAPRLLGVPLANVVRTFDDESFALATLVFMILVPGKPPYSRLGGGDPAENIRSGRFPYPTASRDARDVPPGPWGAIWSGFPRVLKTYFDDAFARHHVVGPVEWRRALQTYRLRLLTGHTSLDVLPVPPRTAPVSEAQFDDGLTTLDGALREPERPCSAFSGGPPTPAPSRPCVDCGTGFELTPRQLDWYARKGLQAPRRCPVCRDLKRQEIPIRYFCKDCLTQFDISAGEARFFHQKGYSLPVRCPSCRRARRHAS